MKGLFICLEGLDGCGKSTQAKLLARWLKKRGARVLLTSEPTQSPIGKLLRRSLKVGLGMPPLAEALLFAADRAWHVKNVIEPALEEGTIVVCERYFYSSLAYQGARGVPQELIWEMNKFFPQPDLAILIDVSPSVVMKRLKEKDLDFFERDLEFQKRVRENYLKLFRKLRLPVIQGNQDIPIIQERIRSLVAPRL